MLAVSWELHIRMDRQISACERRSIQDLHIGTGPFQPDSSTFEVADWNQQVVDSSIFGILMEPSAEVLEEADAAVLEVWPNTANKLIQESTGRRVSAACTAKAYYTSFGIAPGGEGLCIGRFKLGRRRIFLKERKQTRHSGT